MSFKTQSQPISKTHGLITKKAQSICFAPFCMYETKVSLFDLLLDAFYVKFHVNVARSAHDFNIKVSKL